MKENTQGIIELRKRLDGDLPQRLFLKDKLYPGCFLALICEAAF